MKRMFSSIVLAMMFMPTIMIGQTASLVADKQSLESLVGETPSYVEKEYFLNDTVYIHSVDTVYLPLDSITKERPFRMGQNSGGKNWFITLGGGPAIFQGDHNKEAEWGDRLYPSFNLAIGKWIIPFVGFRAGLSFDKVHMYYDGAPTYHFKGAYDKKPGLNKMAYNMWNFRADAMVNLSSLIWRPYKKRIYSLIPYFGMGCMATWDEPFEKSMSINVGLLNSFRVCEQLDINLDLQLRKFDDDINYYIQGRSKEGSTSLTLGLTWYFTKRGF